MKNLLFVSVAIGIFSGTTLSLTAQTSVKTNPFTDYIAKKKSPAFIEGIEIIPGSSGMRQNTVVKTIPPVPALKKPTAEPASKIETCTSLQFKYAQLINVEVESLSNTALYKLVEEWYGTHYLYGGTTRSGVDCSAWTGVVLKNIYGISSPRTARGQFDASDKINREDLKEGDLVFFNTLGGVSHVGFYLGNGYFIHASSKNGIIINHLDENYYKARFIVGGRLKTGSYE